MNRFRPLILASVVVLAALLAYGLWTQPKPQPADAQGFSAARVVKDIEYISKENVLLLLVDTYLLQKKSVPKMLVPVEETKLFLKFSRNQLLMVAKATLSAIIC